MQKDSIRHRRKLNGKGEENFEIPSLLKYKKMFNTISVIETFGHIKHLLPLCFVLSQISLTEEKLKWEKKY